MPSTATRLCPAELHLRPWYRVSRFQGFGRWTRRQELVLRSKFTVAERRGREHQQAHPSLCAERYGPVRRQPAATGRPRPPSQFTVQEVPWLPHARRGLHGPFARLRVIPYPPPVIVARGLDSPFWEHGCERRGQRHALAAPRKSPGRSTEGSRQLCQG